MPEYGIFHEVDFSLSSELITNYWELVGAYCIRPVCIRPVYIRPQFINIASKVLADSNRIDGDNSIFFIVIKKASIF
jgi:hypothetical protein